MKQAQREEHERQRRAKIIEAEQRERDRQREAWEATRAQKAKESAAMASVARQKEELRKREEQMKIARSREKLEHAEAEREYQDKIDRLERREKKLREKMRALEDEEEIRYMKEHECDDGDDEDYPEEEGDEYDWDYQGRDHHYDPEEEYRGHGGPRWSGQHSESGGGDLPGRHYRKHSHKSKYDGRLQQPSEMDGGYYSPGDGAMGSRKYGQRVDNDRVVQLRYVSTPSKSKGNRKGKGKDKKSSSRFPFVKQEHSESEDDDAWSTISGLPSPRSPRSPRRGGRGRGRGRGSGRGMQGKPWPNPDKFSFGRVPERKRTPEWYISSTMLPHNNSLSKVHNIKVSPVLTDKSVFSNWIDDMRDMLKGYKIWCYFNGTMVEGNTKFDHGLEEQCQTILKQCIDPVKRAQLNREQRRNGETWSTNCMMDFIQEDMVRDIQFSAGRIHKLNSKPADRRRANQLKDNMRSLKD